MLKIVVDENIAFAKTAFNQFGNVTLLSGRKITNAAVSYTHLRAHETVLDLVCRLLLEKKKKCN